MSLELVEPVIANSLDCLAALATMSECGSLALSDVSFHYPSRELSSGPHSLLHQISFTVPAASVLHIQGQNGSGKTSLLKLLAGLLRPDAGVITYAGHDIWSNIASYQHNICYLGHKNGIHPNLTVWEQAMENSAYVAHKLCSQLPTPSLASSSTSRGLSAGSRDFTQVLEQCLKNLNIWSLRDQFCATLSAGQKRRLALLRLLVSPAKLWLLDEPLIALDAEGVDFLMACLQEHVANDGQVIYTSHHALPWCAPAQQEYHL